ncbi:MAG: hypothetical protein ACREJQ_08975, partial [bacterium]
MKKTVGGSMLLAMAALGLADCSVIERSGTSPFKSAPAGVYFRHPKAWSVSDTKDGVAVKISGSATVKVTGQDETRDNDIEASDRAADALIERLKKEGWTASLGSSQRVDGTYVRSLTAKKADRSQKVWVIAVHHDFRDYFVTFSASIGEYEANLPRVDKMVQTFQFINETPVLHDNVFFTVTTKNYAMFMFLLIALVAALFLWKDFWVDLWRLVVAPADVFRDVGRGAIIVYPILVVFITGALLAATVLSFRNTILQTADQKVMQAAKSRSEPAIEKATVDPDGRAILRYDVRRRGLAPYEEVLAILPFWIPLIPLILWFMQAVGLFLGIKIGRGHTTFLWVLKGSAFLFVPLFFAEYSLVQWYFSQSIVWITTGGIFALWWLY